MSRSSGVTKFGLPEITVLGASGLVTLAFWVALGFPSLNTNEKNDYTVYYEPVAREILKGNGIRNPDGTPAIAYPPGYPSILAMVFKSASILGLSERSVLLVFTLLCMGTGSILVFMLAECVWPVLPAMITSLLWITYPLGLWMTKQPSSETPFVATFYGSFYLLWRSLVRDERAARTFFLVGFLNGCAILIRPIAIGSGLVMSVILWLSLKEMTRRSRLFLIAILLSGSVVALLPWQVWTFLKTGKVLLLSSNSPNSVIEGLTFGVRQNRKEYRQGVDLPPDVLALMERIHSNSSELKSLEDIALLINQELQTATSAVVKLFIIKAVRSWYATDSQRFETWIMLIQVPYLVLMTWSSRIMWREKGLRRRFVVGVWLMIVYFWVMTTACGNSLVRYMVPATGLLFVTLPSLLPRPFVKWPAKSLPLL